MVLLLKLLLVTIINQSVWSYYIVIHIESQKVSCKGQLCAHPYLPITLQGKQVN